MAIEIPSKGRATIVHHGHEVELRMPVAKNFISIIVMTGWLFFWIEGLIPSIRETFESPADAWESGSLIWAVIGSLVALIALFFLMWMLVGREVVRVSARRIQIERKFLGIGRTREYSMDRVQRLRVMKASVSPFWKTGQRERNPGTIAFDYELQTVGFGGGIAPDEANYLLDELERLGYVHNKRG